METEKGYYVSSCRELNRAGGRGSGGLTQQSTENVVLVVELFVLKVSFMYSFKPTMC